MVQNYYRKVPVAAKNITTLQLTDRQTTGGRLITARRVCIARTMLWQNVCPSVTHGILWTPLKISSKLLTANSTHHSGFPAPNITAIFRRVPPPLTGASNATSMKKSQFSTNIWLYLRNDAS